MMQYRKLGNTGLTVSEIGLGCEGFLKFNQEETDAIIKKAVENGINFMDFYASDPDAHIRVGKALKNYRDKFIVQVHICSAFKDGQYYATRDLNDAKRAFKQTLAEFGFDYADIGMLHYVDSLKTLKQCVDNGIIDYLKELKEKGVIKCIGMSSHNPEVALEAVNKGYIDSLMFSVNPCYDLMPADEDVEKLFDKDSYKQDFLNMDPLRELLYETCAAKGVGITVMKAFGGGDLLNKDNSPAKVSLSVNECLAYALDRPAVAGICCGVRSMKELEEVLKYENSSDKDYAKALASFPKISWVGHCMYCSHCAPCTSGIRIHDVNKFLNLVKAQKEIPETVREHYKALDKHASDCIACKACESRCPFGVKIVDNMLEAKDIFGY